MSGEPVHSDGLPEKARPLVAYLESRARAEGTFYVKSRVVADEIALSAKQVGAYMRRLRETGRGPAVEAWAYANGTTWRVERER